MTTRDFESWAQKVNEMPAQDAGDREDRAKKTSKKDLTACRDFHAKCARFRSEAVSWLLGMG